MRKNKIIVIGIACLLGMMSACGSTGKSQAETQNAAEQHKIDVDLTQLSSTMVYSEVLNMTTTPEDYIGKTVKMNGTFSLYEDETSGQRYFACLISDATACCSQGIEFELEGNKNYPEDYPEVGNEITVVGEFETYAENDYIYCRLKNAKFQ